MPEPTTRDEHIARAQELSAHAWEIYRSGADEVGQPDFYPSVEAFQEALAAARDMTDEKTTGIAALSSLAGVHALLRIGDQLAALLEHLGPPPAEAEPAVWVAINKNLYVRGPWQLVRRNGWYLNGPGWGSGGKRMATDVLVAQDLANEELARWRDMRGADQPGGCS
jgi:hypothetical protein